MDFLSKTCGVQCQALVQLLRSLRKCTTIEIPYTSFEEIIRQREAEAAAEAAAEEEERWQLERQRRRQRKVALENLTADDLNSVLLKSEQLSAYAEVFARYKISGVDAAEMDEGDLIEMGIGPAVKRRALLMAVESYKANGVAAWLANLE